jgi:hypothetical protein
MTPSMLTTRWVKIFAINVVVFLSLFALAELSYRFFLTFSSCIAGVCDFHWVTSLKVGDMSKYFGENIGLSKFDDKLGYIPKDNFDETAWGQKQVTITSEGFRKHDQDQDRSERNILAIGDSFTFGVQVSNQETWPACLEKKLGMRVDNAGVYGYGAAQSLRRAQIILQDKEYYSVILSIVVRDDFYRDTLSYRNGLPKPTLVNTDTGVQWSAVSDPSRKGSRFREDRTLRFKSWIYEDSLLAAAIGEYFLPTDWSGINLTLQHPQAASVLQIIDYTLKQFSSLDTEKKLLVLQYWAPGEDSKLEALLSERREILRAATRYKIDVVDTFDILQNYDKDKIWIPNNRMVLGHHSAFGNKLVCESIYNEAFR